MLEEKFSDDLYKFKHIGTQDIETPRLLLRQISLTDADDMFNNWATERETTMFLSWQPYETIHQVKDFIGSQDYNNPELYFWAIVLKDVNKPMGTIDYRITDKRLSIVETGYCIGKQWWGQGYTTEALKATMNYMFSKVNAQVIRARHDVLNPASGRVMAKCGMQKEGVLRHAGLNNTGICDLVMYSILRNEWVEQNVRHS